MNWGKFANGIRRDLKLTAPQFARMIGVSFVTLQGWLYRRSTPNALYRDLLVRTANALPEVRRRLDEARRDQSAKNEWRHVLYGGECSEAKSIHRLLETLFEDKPFDGEWTPDAGEGDSVSGSNPDAERKAEDDRPRKEED